MKYLIVIALLYCVGIFLFTNKGSVSIANKVNPTPTPIFINSEKLWQIVNEYRASKDLQKFEKNKNLCDIAEFRAKDVINDISPHEGLLRRFSNYPYVISENIVKRPNGEKETVQGWINSPSHRRALEGFWKYSCIACDKSFACVQIFSSFDNLDHNKVD